MNKTIAMAALAGLVTTGCVYDRDLIIRDPYPVEHREHREERQPDRQYEPVRPPAREQQQDRGNNRRQDSGEQRRDSGEQRRDSGNDRGGEQRRDGGNDRGEQRRDSRD